MTRICEVPGCDRPAVAQGICDMHRMRRRLGIPDDQPRQQRATRAEVQAALPRMTEMRQAGATHAEISRAVGITRSVVSRELRAAGITPPPREVPHGRPIAWQQHRCRCPVCVAAKREYKREDRARRIARAQITAEHGTVLAYDQGCRCDECRAAMAARSADRQARTAPVADRSGQPWTLEDMEIALRTDLTIEQRALRLGRTHAAIDDWLRLYRKRPPDPSRD